MSQHFGEIRSDAVYTVEALSRVLGRSLRETREFVEDHVECLAIGRGKYLVAGLCVMQAVERMSTYQTSLGNPDAEPQDEVKSRRNRQKQAKE